MSENLRDTSVLHDAVTVKSDMLVRRWCEYVCRVCAFVEKTSLCPSNPSSGILFRPALTEARSLLLSAPRSDQRSKIPPAVITRRLDRKVWIRQLTRRVNIHERVCNRDHDDLIAESYDDSPCWFLICLHGMLFQSLVLSFSHVLPSNENQQEYFLYTFVCIFVVYIFP